MSNPKVPLAYYHQPDKRLRATQEKLFTALRQLYTAQTPYADVTITRLCRQAGIPRQTFYRHYQNVGQVIEYDMAVMVNDFLQQIDHTVGGTAQSAEIAVKLMLANRTTLEMMFWGDVTEQVIQYIKRDMHRVHGYIKTNHRDDTLRLEMDARILIAFAKTLTLHPEFIRADFVSLFKQTIPSPPTDI